MKKIVLALFVICSTASYAQNGKPAAAAVKSVVLIKGQQVMITAETTQETDMGMGMQLNNKSTTVSKLKVENVTDQGYNISSVLTKLTVNSDMMGKQVAYDSDKKEDRDSEFGQNVSGALDKVENLTLAKFTGIIENNKKDSANKEDSDDPMTLMNAFAEASPALAVSQMIFFVPANMKVGQQWIDSTTKDGLKKSDVYKIESINGPIVTLSGNGTITGTSSMDMQGTAVDMSINSKTQSTITVDTKTNIVKKRITKADVDGSIDMAGQSLPFTGKTTTSITFE